MKRIILITLLLAFILPGFALASKKDVYIAQIDQYEPVDCFQLKNKELSEKCQPFMSEDEFYVWTNDQAQLIRETKETIAYSEQKRDEGYAQPVVELYPLYRQIVDTLTELKDFKSYIIAFTGIDHPLVAEIDAIESYRAKADEAECDSMIYGLASVNDLVKGSFNITAPQNQLEKQLALHRMKKLVRAQECIGKNKEKLLSIISDVEALKTETATIENKAKK